MTIHHRLPRIMRSAAADVESMPFPARQVYRPESSTSAPLITNSRPPSTIDSRSLPAATGSSFFSHSIFKLLTSFGSVVTLQTRLTLHEAFAVWARGASTMTVLSECVNNHGNFILQTEVIFNTLAAEFFYTLQGQGENFLQTCTRHGLFFQYLLFSMNLFLRYSCFPG